MAYTTPVRRAFGYYMLVEIFLLCLISTKIESVSVINVDVNVLTATDYCKGHFESCICTDEKVECHNEKKLYGDITKIFHFIKDNVTSIKITGSNLKELPRNTFGSCRHDTSLVLQKLKLVDLSNNSISLIHGKTFHCVPNIETLILNDNEWEVDRNPYKTGYFTAIGSLKHLYMNNTFSKVWNGNLHLTKLARVFNETDMTKLETLNLGYNNFLSFPMAAANSFCQLTSLKNLDLSHNNLEDPSLPNKPNCLENLQILDFSYNKMSVLLLEFMDKMIHLKNLKSVKLDNNPFNCDCGLVETWKWLNSTKIPVNKYDLKCAGGYHSSYQNKPVLSLSLSDLKCWELEYQSNSAMNVETGIILGVLGLILFAY